MHSICHDGLMTFQICCRVVLMVALWDCSLAMIFVCHFSDFLICWVPEVWMNLCHRSPHWFRWSFEMKGIQIKDNHEIFLSKMSAIRDIFTCTLPMTVDLFGAVGIEAQSHNCIISSGATVSMGTPLISTRVWETLLYELMFFISGGVQQGLPAGPHSAVGRVSERSLSQNVKSRDDAHSSLMAVNKITNTGNRPTIQPIASAQCGYTYGPYEAGWYSTQLKNKINYSDFVRLVGRFN